MLMSALPPCDICTLVCVLYIYMSRYDIGMRRIFREIFLRANDSIITSCARARDYKCDG